MSLMEKNEFTQNGFVDKPNVVAPPVKDVNGDNIVKNVENDIGRQLKKAAPEAAKAIENAPEKDAENTLSEAEQEIVVDAGIAYDQIKEMVDNAFNLIAELVGDENIKNTPAETETIAKIVYRYSSSVDNKMLDVFQFLLVVGKKLLRAKTLMQKIQEKIDSKRMSQQPQNTIAAPANSTRQTEIANDTLS